ncbi:unnamed protein product [Camellia sinensis]
MASKAAAAKEKPSEKKPTEEKKSTVAEKAPAEKKPKAGKKLPKEGGAAAGDKKKKRSKKSIETYKIYIFKVLKQSFLMILVKLEMKLLLLSNVADKLCNHLQKGSLQAKRIQGILLALANLCSQLESCRSRFDF